MTDSQLDNSKTLINLFKMKRIKLIFALAVVTGCTMQKGSSPVINYSETDFQSVVNGKETKLFTLKNSRGMAVTLTNYGAKIVSVFAPGKDGKWADVVLGFKSVADYQKYGASHGATVGPYANRIAGASFVIDGQQYNLPKNNGGNCIHSGPDSFYRQVWDAAMSNNSVEMTILSPDGEWGFPGNKKVKVTFSLNDQNELRIDYVATTDKPTHFSLTNHSYFNLKGEGNGDILSHVAVINSSELTVVDSMMIPTGEIIPIAGTDLDFSTPHAFGERIDNGHPLLKAARGYDFNYIINKAAGELGFAASALDPESGRLMEVFTTEPAVQLYTGNNLKGTETGKKGVVYGPCTGFCFETQHYPDTPNKPGFPGTLLLPGDTLHSTTIFRFSVKSDESE
jgi:aldose 1-epimerase